MTITQLRGAEEAARLRARNRLTVSLCRHGDAPLDPQTAKALLHLARVAFGGAPQAQAKTEAP